MAPVAVRRSVFAAVLAASLAVAALELAEPLDLRLLDLQFRALRAWHPRAATPDVVVVGIDEDTTRALPEPIALWHRHLERFLEAMAAAKPLAVGVDVALPARSFDGVLPGSDVLLTRGLVQAKRTYPLVVALSVSPSGKARPVHPLFLGAVGEGGTGYAAFPVDADGRIRRLDEREFAAPLFSTQVARRLGVEPRGGAIDYSRGERFDYVPFHRVLEWHARGELASLTREFTGKAVLLGVVLPYTDDHAAPVQLAGWDGWPASGMRVPGVLLHAQALRNLLDGGLLQAVPRPVVVAAAAAAAGLWFVSAGWTTVVALLAGIVVVLLAASSFLVTRGWVLPVAPVAIAAAAGLGVRLAFDTLAQLRERRRLRASFAGYVSPAVMDEILAGRIQPDDAGVRRFVCVLFSDIRGYTARGEQMRPEEVIAFLNRYFEQALPLVHERGGAVVSIMGDGMMAVFGTPKALDNPCRAAFEAARAMLAHAAGLGIDIGIGVNAGEAVVGHVGARDRHEYSAIGDVTNVASRLQGLTKETGYRLVLSREVAERLGGSEGLADLGALQVRGHSPVEAFGYDKRA